MPKKVYKTTRKYACPFCKKKFPRMDLIDHVDKEHESLIPEDYSAARIVYDSINKTDHGTCMICKKPVYTWNEKISRYNNLCDSKKCREEVRRIALERHIKTYNAPTLLDNPEHQEKMLANRHISGKYKHTDGAVITYTGKYEKAALEFMDQVMNIPSKDIQMPGPILEYEYDGKTHSWITDIYYIPANLIIEVKDGGDNPNNRNMPEYRGKQYAKEVMITELGKFNYLRLTNNNFSQLLEALAEIKYENMDQKDANKVNFFINESAILNESYYVYLSKKDENDIKEILDSLDEEQRSYLGNDYFIDKYKIIYFDINRVNGKAAGFITVVSRMEGPYGFVMLAVKPEYQGKGIAKRMASKMIQEFKKSKKCRCLTWNIDFGNNASEKVAKDVGFKFYKKYKNHIEYDYIIEDKEINESAISEEVGGIPPRRATANWIEPCLIDSTWDLSIGNDSSDTVLVRGTDNEIKAILKKDYQKEYETNGEALIYNGEDSTEIFNKLMRGEMSFTEALYTLVGYKFRSLDELALLPNWSFVDHNDFKVQCDVKTLGVVRENEILSGKVKVFETDTPIKGSVILTRSSNGYFVHTPDDFYLSSNYYDTPEEIPQNVIDIMADLYEQNKRGVSNG